MRWLATVMVGSVLISEAYAQPDRVQYELQERCGKRAAEVFQKEWGTNVVRSKDGLTTGNYENHYNPRLNKCFYLELSSVISKPPSGETTSFQSLRLYDLNENKQYGSFGSGTQLGVVDCQVQGKVCRSEQEWRELARPFLED